MKHLMDMVNDELGRVPPLAFEPQPAARKYIHQSGCRYCPAGDN